ncbi:MAG: 5-(carboxyamino)imidazole ribonucleotide synthase [Pseudanabaenaceae cyanobacterium bins.39]|nr:5-(carboxyamino)imidazole ribonucleotide synthase [Pseudanabaenaceae cyanobacterium bins.39]
MSKRECVGVIGGGQLAWMMAIAAQKIGLQIAIQASHPDEPAVNFANSVVFGSITDVDATTQLTQMCQVITFENEFVDLEGLGQLERQYSLEHSNQSLFLPKLATLEICVDKLKQRQFFQSHQIPTPSFYGVNCEIELINAATNLGYPLVLKTRRHGYDGKGTWVVNDEIELRNAWQGMQQAAAIAEAFIPFETELAVMAVRSEQGETAIYPVVETLQIGQVCRRTIAPARISPDLADRIVGIAEKILTSLNVVGVIGIEFFMTEQGEVSVNEIAPRTHNSGHYTIEGCHTSQFEQIMRVVSGMPLGDVAMVAPVAVMVNLLGTKDAVDLAAMYADERAAIACFPNTFVHWYNKKKSSVGRKLGHVTILAETYDRALEISDRITSIWYGSGQNADLESISNKRFS